MFHRERRKEPKAFPGPKRRLGKMPERQVHELLDCVLGAQLGTEMPLNAALLPWAAGLPSHGN